jgi:hypothetical protein
LLKYQHLNSRKDNLRKKQISPSIISDLAIQARRTIVFFDISTTSYHLQLQAPPTTFEH